MKQIIWFASKLENYQQYVYSKNSMQFFTFNSYNNTFEEMWQKIHFNHILVS